MQKLVFPIVVASEHWLTDSAVGQKTANKMFVMNIYRNVNGKILLSHSVFQKVPCIWAVSIDRILQQWKAMIFLCNFGQKIADFHWFFVKVS